jgi:glycosyltransferase involved in cell wall biosynthesis
MINNSDRLRILIPVLGFGRTGGNRVLAELANAWVRAGHEVAFTCPETSEEPYFPTQAEVHWLDVRGDVAKRALGANPTGFGNVVSIFGGVKRLQRAFDVVLANHSLTPLPIVLAGVPRSKRFYYIQAYEPEYYALARRPFMWLLARLSYALPLTQIANASIYRHALVNPVAIVPFGIDLNLFSPKRYLSRKPNAPLTIGCIGRSEPQKGTPYVLEAFERFHAQDPRHRLRIAYGNLPAGWSHEAAEVVTPNGDGELASFYRSLDVLVAAGTVQHGAPHYPVLEALASGVSVITTGFQPATDANAWLVPNRDPAAIANALTFISLDPVEAARKTRLGLKAVQRFAWDAVAEQAIAVFQNFSQP